MHTTPSQKVQGRAGYCAGGLGLLLAWSVCAAQQTTPYFDLPGDGRLLRLDGGTNGPPPGGPALPDLLSYEIGAWQPDDPAGSLFRGQWQSDGSFFRLDLVYAGLVNPPGFDVNSLFLFGPNPLLGFVEFDMDSSVATGGELAGASFRYTGSAARFGGVPTAPRFNGRIALDTCPFTFDADISTGPFFPERSGEEFHLALLWGEVTSIDAGSNGDLLFDADESWVVTGTFLHRAHGFEDFILLCCSNGLPGYVPQVELLFAHAAVTNRTTVSLVYPLTNDGAAAITGEVAQPNDCCADNHNSVLEGLEHLVLSAELASAADRQDVNYPLIEQWEFQSGGDYLDPTAWNITVLVAGAFVDPGPMLTVLAWTDLAPNVREHDFNGDGVVDGGDVALFDGFLAGADGGSCDADGVADGVFRIINFGAGFNMFDVNYDGLVNPADRPEPGPPVPPFDGDGDGDVDLADFAGFQRCFSDAGGFLPPACVPFDGNHDGRVDVLDLPGFMQVLTGPVAVMFP